MVYVLSATLANFLLAQAITDGCIMGADTIRSCQSAATSETL